MIRVLPRSEDSTGVLNIRSESGPILAITDRTAEDEANAVFIVQAVNSHARLSDVLKTAHALLNELDGEALLTTGVLNAGILYEHATALRAALSAAKE